MAAVIRSSAPGGGGGGGGGGDAAGPGDGRRNERISPVQTTNYKYIEKISRYLDYLGI